MAIFQWHTNDSLQRQRVRQKRKNCTMIYQVIVIFVYDGLAGPCAITSHLAIARLSVCLSLRMHTYIVRGIYYIWIVLHTVTATLF